MYMELKKHYSLIMEWRIISTDNQHLANIDLVPVHLQDEFCVLFHLSKYIYQKKINS